MTNEEISVVLITVDKNWSKWLNTLTDDNVEIKDSIIIIGGNNEN